MTEPAQNPITVEQGVSDVKAPPTKAASYVKSQCACGGTIRTQSGTLAAGDPTEWDGTCDRCGRSEATATEGSDA